MVTTQLLTDNSLPNCCVMTGKTALTTLPSSADINVPVPMANKTHHLRSKDNAPSHLG